MCHDLFQAVMFLTSTQPVGGPCHGRRLSLMEFKGTVVVSKLYATVQSDHAAGAAKSLQSCPTLCDSIVGSP